MEFKHSEERQMLIDMLARYLQNDYPLQARNIAAESDAGFSDAQWRSFCDLGIAGAFFDEDQGGFGGSAFDIVAVFENLGRALVVEPLLDCGLLPGQLFAAAGETRHLADVIGGVRRFAVALPEGNKTACHATRTDLGWTLTGTSAQVSFATATDAVLVTARTGAEAADMTLFLVPVDAPGLSLVRFGTFDGGSVADLGFEGVQLGDDHRIGPAHGAAPLVATARAWGTVAICAEALGIMETIKAMTLDYLRTRSQFGTTIGRFQALQHRMAQVLLEIEQARSAVINAAAAMDQPEEQRDRMISAAKYTVGRIGTLVTEESIQLHGGIGMTWEYELGHFAKRLMMIDHSFGDMDHHLARFMALRAS